ncbi:hypothetical protein BGX28_001352, partial [Mortierella sp. GBA30]
SSAAPGFPPQRGRAEARTGQALYPEEPSTPGQTHVSSSRSRSLRKQPAPEKAGSPTFDQGPPQLRRPQVLVANPLREKLCLHLNLVLLPNAVGGRLGVALQLSSLTMHGSSSSFVSTSLSSRAVAHPAPCAPTSSTNSSHSTPTRRVASVQHNTFVEDTKHVDIRPLFSESSVAIAIRPTDNSIVTTTATSQSTVDQIKRHINYYHVFAEDGKGEDTLEPPYALPPVNGITAQRVNKLSRMINARERQQRRVKH